MHIVLLHITHCPPPPGLPVEALHSDEELLAGRREVAAAAPVEAVHVGDVGAGQLPRELGRAAGLVAPLVAGPVVGALWLGARQLLVLVAGETLTCELRARACIQCIMRAWGVPRACGENSTANEKARMYIQATMGWKASGTHLACRRRDRPLSEPDS